MKVTLVFVTLAATVLGVSYAACPNRDPLGLSDPGFFEKVGCSLEKAWDDTSDAVKKLSEKFKNSNLCAL